ncbi:MAG: ABC transporter permease [Nocardioides sp.]|uniref:ABC transporter permease n=1 Tax=Nocardioides sp. TaxID=35761 RepID=UPI0032677417
MTTLTVLPDVAVVRRRSNLDMLTVVVATVCSALVVLAILGPFLTPYPPAQTDILAASQGPSAQHLLGTDALGRDILSRLLAGARLSFAGPGLIVAVSTTAGTAIAIWSAWHGGLLDKGMNRVLDVMFAVPGILVAVLAAAVFGSGFWAPVLALSIVYIPYVARVVRSAAVRERRLPYVEACQLAGMRPSRICSRHILRNVAPIALAQGTIAFASALMDFAAISFLGLGVQPPVSEWGLMVSDGRSELLDGAAQQSLAAGAMVVLTVVAFNVLGERVSRRIGGNR